MDIWNALRRAGREDITIRAVLAKTIGDVYNHEVIIESVKIHGKKIIIKTGKPLINSELQMLEWRIKELSIKKLKDMWIKITQDVKFRFV